MNTAIDIAGNVVNITSEMPKKYDQNKYNKTFIEKNIDKIHEKHTCDVCCGSFTYFNKSKHLRSKKHVDLMNKMPPAPPIIELERLQTHGA
jgi:hypothetical protein